jgi:lipopolysaccharide/colanic/teichoic acid biosynthesis glycosyltransferase
VLRASWQNRGSTATCSPRNSSAYWSRLGPNGVDDAVQSSIMKRFFDLALGVPAALLLLPVALTIAFLVRILLGSPVLFRQRRPGLGGHPFDMFKFRSMSDACDASGRLLPDDMRLGRFGRWLRASSLDELPELYNVLRSEMSLVGPRPLLMEYLPLYSDQQRRRHEVPPGITGWAQVNGRNALSWQEKFALDIWYVDHWSLGLDLRILWLTLLRVVARDGIAQEGQATAEKFRGNRV